MNLRKIIFIVGPTAVGKTSFAVNLAEKINGEIVSCDSMQIYKEINIASAKPTREQMQKIPHHLVDILPVDKDFDVSRFSDLANKKIDDILRKEKIPIVVGGSGMYVGVLLDGIFEGGEKNWGVRQRLQERIEKEGQDSLYADLRMLDPHAAEKIHPHDTRRIIRALEIYQVTGKPISLLQKGRKGLWDSHDVLLFGLECPRQELYAAINKRVEGMFSAGIIEEMSRLGDRVLSRTAQQIIGVREIRGFLNHEYGQEQAKYLMQRNTRRFAKRQMTWFRRDDRIKWLPIGDAKGIEPALEEIIKNI